MNKTLINQIEGYIQKHSDAQFSHGMCPECSDELYGKEDWYIEMKNEKKQKNNDFIHCSYSISKIAD
ncbi:MAG: hypothetical protein KKE12_14915 [Proteobacteria bacterium]|nr:hypothetical protein [Pseudomonadota bacterium]